MSELTIGIISFNEEKNIVNLLRSLKSQYLGNNVIKKIVISDDSFDRTPILVNDFAIKNKELPIILLHNENRRGAALGWNDIFKESEGEFLVLYDADITLDSMCTFNLLGQFDEKIGLCASNPQPIKILNIYGKSAGFVSNWLRKIRKNGLTQFTVMGRALAIRNELAKKIVVPENIIAIDYFLQSAVLSLGKEIYYVDDAKVFFKAPDNLYDFLLQILRADSGHKQISSLYQYKRLTFFSTLKTTMSCILQDPLGGLSLAYCYTFLPYYKIRHSDKISSKWTISESTKS